MVEYAQKPVDSAKYYSFWKFRKVIADLYNGLLTRENSAWSYLVFHVATEKQKLIDLL
jgi:hypothetical protein